MTVAVLDTNVLVSGLVFPTGVPGRVVSAASDGLFDLAVSDYILDELEEVLARIPGVSTDLRHHARSSILQYARKVEPMKLTWSVRDPKDNPVIATALAAGAEYLVSGDKDLLVLKMVGSLRILTPRSFAKVVGIGIPGDRAA